MSEVPAALSARERRVLRQLARPVLIVAISIIVGYVIVAAVGAIDWNSVRDALGRLAWWELVPLISLLLLRQGMNAVPLQQFVSSLSWRRSVQNDLGAVLVGTLTPPPSDVVLRISMFRSWGINPADGMAGVTLNTITFYAVRFLAPPLGLLLLVWQGVERHQFVFAAVSALIALAILTGLYLLTRDARIADIVGRVSAQVAARFSSKVDERSWAQSVVDFRSRMVGTLLAGLLVATIGLIAMVLADGLILLLAVRFTGTDAAALSTLDIVAGFLLVYPFTLMPLAGFGILDASLIATFTTIAGL